MKTRKDLSRFDLERTKICIGSRIPELNGLLSSRMEGLEDSEPAPSVNYIA